MRRLLAAAGHVVADLAQLGDQLDALRLAAGERGRGLAQRQVAQADVLQQLERVRDVRHRGEELHRLVDLHLQHVADALCPAGDGQRLGLKRAPKHWSHGTFTSGRKAISMVRIPWPSQAGQRPSPVLKLKRPAA